MSKTNKPKDFFYQHACIDECWMSGIRTTHHHWGSKNLSKWRPTRTGTLNLHVEVVTLDVITSVTTPFTIIIVHLDIDGPQLASRGTQRRRVVPLDGAADDNGYGYSSPPCLQLCSGTKESSWSRTIKSSKPLPLR